MNFYYELMIKVVVYSLCIAVLFLELKSRLLRIVTMFNAGLCTHYVPKCFYN